MIGRGQYQRMGVCRVSDSSRHPLRTSRIAIHKCPVPRFSRSRCALVPVTNHTFKGVLDDPQRQPKVETWMRLHPSASIACGQTGGD